MSSATFRREAEADVYAAAKHIAEEAGTLAPAHRFVDTMTTKADLLATQPEMAASG